MENWRELIQRIHSDNAAKEMLEETSAREAIERRDQETRDLAARRERLALLMQDAIKQLGVPSYLESLRREIWQNGQIDTFSEMHADSSSKKAIKSGYRLIYKYPTTIDLGKFRYVGDDDGFDTIWESDIKRTEGYTDLCAYLSYDPQRTTASFDVASRVFLGRGRSGQNLRSTETDDIYLNASDPTYISTTEQYNPTRRYKPQLGRRLGSFNFDGSMFIPRESILDTRQRIRDFFAGDIISREEHGLMPERIAETTLNVMQSKYLGLKK